MEPQVDYGAQSLYGFAQVLLETMPMGVLLHDAAGRMISANPAAVLLVGPAVRSLEKADWPSLEFWCQQEDGSAFPWRKQPALVSLQTGKPQFNVEMKFCNREADDERWLRITAIPFSVQGAKQPNHAYCLLEDITERKKAERLQQEEAVSRVLCSLNDGSWDWSQAQNKIVASPRLLAMLGYEEAEISDRPDLLHRIIHPDDRIRVGQLISEGLEGKADHVEAQYRLSHKLGHSVHVVSRIMFMRDNGGLTHVCGTSLDISDRLQLEQDLLKYQSKLQVANETLERRVMERTEALKSAIQEMEAFSYTVSHDLRAPLRHINSFSAILREEYGAEMPAEARSYLDRIGTASSKMGALIDDLLTLSRVSRTELAQHPVNLSDLAAELLCMYRETDPQRTVTASISEGLTACGDRTLLRQLLDNLLGNAWKYTSSKPSAHIEFGAEMLPTGEVFFVRDDGVGFDMDYKEKLFAAFERLHGSEFPGLGIGLATSQRIVKRHGGVIWAEGKVGEGATFYFALPSTAKVETGAGLGDRVGSK